MIRKFFVCGKQLLLTAKRAENAGGKGGDPVYEVLLPIETYWEVDKLLKEADYLIASTEDPVQILELNRRIIKKVANYVINEKERIQLKERMLGAGHAS